MDCQKSTGPEEPTSDVSSVQQPGEIIRPVVGDGCVEELVLRKYGLTVTKVKELNSYDDRNYFIQVSPQHSNPAIQELHSAGYVLKIYNSKDSLNPASLDAQHAVMSCLIKNGIPCQTVIPDLNGNPHSLELIYPKAEKKGTPGKYLVEIRTFIPGRIIQDVPYTTNLLLEDGRLIAKMTKAFENWENDHLRSRDPSSRLWSLTSVPKLTQYTFCLEKEERGLIEDIVSTFNVRMVSQYQQLPKGYVHGDANEQNILVSQNASGDDNDVSGILDFADAEFSYPVIDIAENIAYMMIDSEVVDQLDTPGYILAGYLSVRALTHVEWDVLVPCVAGRLAQSLTLGAHAQYLEPENTYVLTTAKKGWPLLKKFWAESENELISRWKTIISNCK